jgi:hypothetical protein
MNKQLAFLLVSFIVLPANCVAAAPIQWEGNGHFYELVETPLTWSEARAAAQAKGGYLATVTSPEENAFIFNRLVGRAGIVAWLGGWQNPANVSYREPDLGWQWVTDDDGLRFSFDVDPFRREWLLKGLDDIGLTLQDEDKIREHEARRIVFR